MTYRDTISSIRSDFRLVNSDNLINNRSILAQVKDVANMIMGQSFAKRKYWQSPNAFSYVPCIKMKQVPLSECCDYTGDAMVAISEKPLPKIGEGAFGLAIQGVFGLDFSIKFNPTNPNRYSNLLKLGTPGKDKYFWVTGEGHLIVTNPDSKRVHGYFYFTELIPNSLLVPEKDCQCSSKSYDVETLCSNPLDQRFPFVAERVNDLKNQVVKNLLSTYYNVNQDRQSDDVDGQAKNQNGATG